MERFFEFVVNHWAWWLAGAVVVLLLVLLEVKDRIAGAVRLSAQETVDWMNHKNALVWDVRDAKAFAAGHISGAQSVPYSQFQSKLTELEQHKDMPVVLVCARGQTVQLCAAVLTKKGFSQLAILQGGMAAWQNANLPVVKS